MQFLNSAWLLSQSGTVANRLGQVLEKQGQPDKARHMYALAVAAGGSDVPDSLDRLGKLVADANILQMGASRPGVQKDVADATMELAQSRKVKLGQLNLGAITSKTASARFNLVFDGSPRPERAEFVEGDESLRSAGEKLREKDFPVRFPDASSIKIVRRAQLSCGSSGCAIELLPIEDAPTGPGPHS
jgi:hypothetical protein